MRSHRTRLRHKRSHMLCNLINFISVNQELEVWWGQLQGEDIKKKERSKVKKHQRVRKEVRGGNWLPPPRI